MSNDRAEILADQVIQLRRTMETLQGENTRLTEENERLRKQLSGRLQDIQELTCGDVGYTQLGTLLSRAIDTMAALHRSIEPMEDDPELAGRVPPAAMRAFVDALAGIDRERFSLPQAELDPESKRILYENRSNIYRR